MGDRNLEVIPVDNPELYRMEPPASTRWGQIATGTPLKECKWSNIENPKAQISKESWGPGPPFPRENSKGEYMINNNNNSSSNNNNNNNNNNQQPTTNNQQ